MAAYKLGRLCSALALAQVDSNPRVLLAGETLLCSRADGGGREGGRLLFLPLKLENGNQKRQVLESKGEQTHFRHAEYADSLFSEHVICFFNNQA